MGYVTIEESDEGRSIVTPDLRLHFRWIDDRWTHSIELGPAPWQEAITSIEWRVQENPEIARPTYQDLHFQRDGEDVLALTVGQSGPHHFSASFRVRFRAYRQNHFGDDSILQDRSESEILVDVADRCRVEGCLEAHYRIHRPPVVLALSPYAEADPSNVWTSQVVWESSTPNNEDISFSAWNEPAPTHVALATESDHEGWRVRAAPVSHASGGTRRLGYKWSHHRVNVLHTSETPEKLFPWSLPGCADPGGLA